MGYSDVVAGQPPSIRSSFAFTAVGGYLFVFGGENYSSSMVPGDRRLQFHDASLQNLRLLYPLSVGLNDLYMLDPSSLEWARIDQRVLGSVPSGRYDFGFTAAGKLICIFGGASDLDSGTRNSIKP